MKYAWLAIGIFAARFLATAIAFPQRDGDLAWQRWLGAAILRAHAIPRTLGRETFTAVGSPWVPQEWAFSIGAALATHGIAWVAFSGALALAATASLAIAAAHAQRLGASPRANALCTALAGVALFASFGVRAQVAAWPLLALFLLLLDVESPLAYAAIGVAAVWSNVHASAMLAPVLAGAVAFGTWIDDGMPRAFVAVGPNVRRRAAIALASVAAICCNPFGIGLPRYALALFGSPFKSAISEWKPTDLGDASFALGALPLLIGAMLFVAGPGPRRARDAIVLAVFSYLVLSATRNVAIFGIVALPLVASAFTRRTAFFAPEAAGPPDRVARVLFPAVACVLAVVVATGLLRSGERRTDAVASRAIASIAALPGERRVLCGDFAWCGLAVGMPNARVFLDGRADPYPQTVWNDYLSVARLSGRWRTTLDARRVDTIVVARDSALDDALTTWATWRESYRDAGYRVWIRRSLGQRDLTSSNDEGALPLTYIHRKNDGSRN